MRNPVRRQSSVLVPHVSLYWLEIHVPVAHSLFERYYVLNAEYNTKCRLMCLTLLSEEDPGADQAASGGEVRSYIQRMCRSNYKFTFDAMLFSKSAFAGN